MTKQELRKAFQQAEMYTVRLLDGRKVEMLGVILHDYETPAVACIHCGDPNCPGPPLHLPAERAPTPPETGERIRASLRARVKKGENA